MPLALIDYTPFYYTSVAGTGVPSVTTGKFVQILLGDTMYLVLSPRELTKYHSNIIERFCMDKGIEGSFDAKREKFTITDQAWRIVGGGKFERDENKKAIKFYDDSMAYGKFDGTGLQEALASLPGLSGYTIMLA
jgi:hypothetical protein